VGKWEIKEKKSEIKNRRKFVAGGEKGRLFNALYGLTMVSGSSHRLKTPI